MKDMLGGKARRLGTKVYHLREDRRTVTTRD